MNLLELKQVEEVNSACVLNLHELPVVTRLAKGKTISEILNELYSTTLRFIAT